ncbi:MAG: hypothetical protein AAGA71_21820, partial [Pseudomonadota bacterium]
MNSEIIDAGRDMSGGYKVDVSRGGCVDRVSSEWFSRPDDERYLSLDDLFASVKGRAERSRTRTVASAAIRVIDGIRAARAKIVARSDEDRQDFLRKRGFSKAETGRIVETVLTEEGRPPESVFDFVQGITAVARAKPQ